MLISEELLLTHGATYENYKSKEVIFQEGSQPKFYFQIVTGTVELNNYHEDGKEFTQYILSNGQSFGESLLFSKQPYPMNATAKTECVILRLSITDFFALIEQNSSVVKELFRLMSDRLYYKYIMLYGLSSLDPQIKIKRILDYFKSMQTSNFYERVEIPYTRQQIANLTGLRVETVIRNLKKMEIENIVKINGRKLLY
ncbi:Crp/Fnr family transcriptional regulator [Chryseobacterium sp. WLY505]|uniref:Crp/Fnr family transcriptional regulator n=1 Tax=Chryseobacterium sp. WLY505 TaxID=3068892 RepID=UPI0027968D0F|nr:Crp/Fnr family transcriptional regulator [Chryseobacterium sp. WLY505]MDQ1855773.1 Crp/Fnr family transcriptional regulator [Chryseobacterium sp. WLY505]